MPNRHRIERTYPTTTEDVWELWTTREGMESWWAPDGFTVEVEKLELEPGGELVYTMTATAPEQVEFMRNAGMPLSAEVPKTFTRVVPPTRLAYLSLIDFVPDHEPYEHLTTIDIEPTGDRTNVIMTIDPLHDETWTQEYRDHRAKELDKQEEFFPDTRNEEGVVAVTNGESKHEFGVNSTSSAYTAKDQIEADLRQQKQESR